MKKRFIITGMITLLGMINLTLTSNFSWGSDNKDSTAQTLLPFSKEEYLKIIELLKQQITTNESQIENAKKIHQSITGNAKKIHQPITESESESETKDLEHTIHTLTTKSIHYFLQDPPYPSPHKNYKNMGSSLFKMYSYIEVLMTAVNGEDYRAIFSSLPQKKIYDIINTRLNYNGIVEKAVSLQAFQDAEKRFTQIADFLNDIDKTTNLREVFELQTRIKSMSSMLQNEYTKLQMVRNLSNNEKTLIDIQKRLLYKKIINSANKRIPPIRLN
ncbi:MULTISPECIES: type IV secretion system protein [unclassified Bartonella]|uniref:type IV secretion system protein n=1 Tax=unclassified Bartonella TaxID=2645622 RepID=UPI0035CE8FC0